MAANKPWRWTTNPLFLSQTDTQTHRLTVLAGRLAGLVKIRYRSGPVNRVRSSPDFQCCSCNGKYCRYR